MADCVRESITLVVRLPVELQVLTNPDTESEMPRHLIVAIVLSIAVAAGAFVALRVSTPEQTRAALVFPEPAPVPAFALVDHEGAPADGSVFEGRWNLVFFGFTHCPDVCPTTLQVLATAQGALRDRGLSPLPRIVLVSVDPERDTPEVLGRYVAHFGSGSLGLTGELTEIRALTDGLGIFFEKRAGEGDNYGVDHSAAVLVIDPQGRLRGLFGAPHLAEDYVHDLPILMAAR